MQRQLSPRECCASIPPARPPPPRQRFFKECDCIPDHLPPIYLTIFQFMSQHPSLKGKSSIAARRSVLKRFERVELLRKRGQFKDGQRVMGLPKTKPED
jgi:small basic protein (TIGR04137 family)